MREIADVFGKDVVRTGHFIDDAGHTETIIDLSGVARLTRLRKAVLRMMREELLRVDPQVVVALPEARELGQTVGDYLDDYSQSRSGVQNVYGLPDEAGEYHFPFSFAPAVRDSRVVIVAPVVNDARRLVRMVDACRRLNAAPKRIFAIVNLTGIVMVSDVPIFTPFTHPVPHYTDERTCPACRAGVPLEEWVFPRAA